MSCENCSGFCLVANSRAITTDFEVSGVGTTPSGAIGVIDLDVDRLRAGGVGRAFGTREDDGPGVSGFAGRGEKGGVDDSMPGVFLADSGALGVDPLFSSSASPVFKSSLRGVACACFALRGVVLPNVEFLVSPPDDEGITMSPKLETSMDRRELRVRLSFRLSFKGLSLRCAFVRFNRAFGLCIGVLDS